LQLNFFRHDQELARLLLPKNKIYQHRLYPCMNIRPLFSIVIPTYNRGNILPAAVRSVLAQSCPDFELIIVDDGSSDDTATVVAGFADHRIRYMHQENGGGSKARNTGIKAAQGKYIAFLDADDTFLPDHLANALPVLESGNMTCTYTQVIVDRGHGLSFLKPPRAPRPDEHIADYLFRDRGFVQTSTLIVPARLAKQVKYDEQLHFGQDPDFAIRLVHAGAHLQMLPEPGAVWNDRWSPSRLSSKHDPEVRLAWLERTKKLLTRRAYLADRGWHVAKAYARQGKSGKALALYLRALAAGCFRPKMALVVFLQIILPVDNYRKLADSLARCGFRP